MHVSGRVGKKTCFFCIICSFFLNRCFFCFFPQCFFPLKPARSKTQFFPTSAFGARLFYPQEKSAGWEKKRFFCIIIFSSTKKASFYFLNKKNMSFFKPNPAVYNGPITASLPMLLGGTAAQGGGLAGAVMWYIRDSMRQEKCRRGRRRIGLLLGICLLTSARRSFHPWPVIFLQALFLWTTIYSRSPL